MISQNHTRSRAIGVEEAGEGLLWLMDGLTVRATAALPTIADLNWVIVGPG